MTQPGPAGNPYRKPGETPQDWEERYRKAEERRDGAELLRLEDERRWDAQRANEELDLLAPTLEEEARFLAKVYVWAKYFNSDKELVDRLNRVVHLRPDKVRDAADMFGRLSRIYDAVAKRAGEQFSHLRVDWKGDAADAFSMFFIGYGDARGLVGSISSPSRQSLSSLASATARLLDEFAKSLTQWRNSVAEKIKQLSKDDEKREKEALSEYTDIIDPSAVTAAAQMVDALLKTLSAFEAQKNDRDLLLFDDFIRMQDAKRSLPNEDEYKKETIARNLPEPRVV